MSELEIIDCEQNSPEWFAARAGIVTASRFKDVLAKGEGKVRAKYMRELACEIVRGAPSPYDVFTNAHMERGHEYEPRARDYYAFLTGNELTQVGFMRRGRIGYSPDSLVSDSGLVEIKTKLDHLHAECLLLDKVPTEHIAQIQGGLLVSGREWLDFVSHCDGLPLFIKRVTRDEEYISKLEKELAVFVEELDCMVDKLRNYQVAA